MKAVITDDRHHHYEVEKAILEPLGFDVVVLGEGTKDELLANCRDADALLANLALIDREVVESLEKCRVISRYGVGFDNVDVAACTEKGIQVGYAPHYCENEVAEHALALIMSCARRTTSRDRKIRQGQWNISDKIVRIAGKTCGILGFGHIAQGFCERVRGFGFAEILAYDPYLDADFIAGFGARKASFEEVLTKADFISVHIPLNPSTRGIINKEAFALMKPDAVIVNTARGPVIDQQALIDTLAAGKLNGVGLDVYDTEPLALDSPLRQFDNVVLTDHTGYYSEESLVDLKTITAQNVAEVFAGRPPLFIVPPQKDVKF